MSSVYSFKLKKETMKYSGNPKMNLKINPKDFKSIFKIGVYE